jgi:DNA-binding MltR family transcriptional regulator
MPGVRRQLGMSKTTKHSKIFLERREAVTEFRQSLDPETDRGCALMAAAYLDSELEKLLRKYLVNNDAVQSQLFEHSGPLGSFSSRIDLAYLLGLIGRNAHRDLHLIRRIRNEFGHVPRPISFDDPQLASRCRELYHDTIGKAVRPRTKFNRVVMGVLAILHGNFHRITPLEEARDIVIDDKFKKHTCELIETLRAERDAEQIVGRERRGRVSHHDSSGDA